MINPVVILLKIHSLVVSKFWAFFGRRPASRNYITGDSFRALADHIWDEWTEPRFEPADVNQGDIVFISNWHIPRFFDEIAPEIQAPFVLISSNGDQNVHEHHVKKIPDTLIHWFSQNVLATHTRLTPIPIGIENRRLGWHGNIGDFDRLRNGVSGLRGRKANILFGFNMANGPEHRKAAIEVLEKHGLATKCVSGHPYQYRRILRRYQYVCSPPGNGEDCHRTWEALYLGVIPIVRKSAGTEYFKAAGLPLLLIEDWNELHNWDTEALQKMYETRSSMFAAPVLFFDYWRAKILAVQAAIRT